jgi:hypothetical protein
LASTATHVVAYSFDVAAGSKAGDWALMFGGRTEHVPEHGLRDGASLLCRFPAEPPCCVAIDGAPSHIAFAHHTTGPGPPLPPHPARLAPAIAGIRTAGTRHCRLIPHGNGSTTSTASRTADARHCRLIPHCRGSTTSSASQACDHLQLNTGSQSARYVSVIFFLYRVECSF